MWHENLNLLESSRTQVVNLEFKIHVIVDETFSHMIYIIMSTIARQMMTSEDTISMFFCSCAVTFM